MIADAWQLIGCGAISVLRRLGAGFIALALCSCTSAALRDSTLSSGATLTDLTYQMVLDNIAMAKARPGILPWHVKITNGTVTVMDTVAPSFAIASPKTVYSPGISASRMWTESWATVPVVDRKTLNALQRKYQALVEGRGEACLNSGGVRIEWIQWQERTSPSLIGRYGAQVAWVKEEDLHCLTEFTLAIQELAPVEPFERNLIVPVPAR